MSGNVVSATLRSGLFTRVVGKRILFFQEVPSTMDEAARLAASGTCDGTVVVAEIQTAGRGRQGRSWVSMMKEWRRTAVAVAGGVTSDWVQAPKARNVITAAPAVRLHSFIIDTQIIDSRSMLSQRSVAA